MGKLRDKKDYLLIGIVLVLFALMSYLSLTSIYQLRGNVRVVNYAGIVRGATQRLVKKELQGFPDDALIKRLDGIVVELSTGEGENNLVVLADPTYLDNLQQVQHSWDNIKDEIYRVRAGADSTRLFEMSEDYFMLVDRTVSSAETYSESQVSISTSLILAINGVFVALVLVGIIVYLRAAGLRRRNDVLGKIAYIDPVTQLPNRASCEKEMTELRRVPPEGNLAVILFGINDLKRMNDLLGHQGGDRVVADFAQILKKEGEEFGFVGRYSGAEFVAIFQTADEARAANFLNRVQEKVSAYNQLSINGSEELSFSSAYVIEDVRDMPVKEMIDRIDRKLYARKQQVEEVK